MSVELKNINKVLKTIGNLHPRSWAKEVLDDMRADHKPVRATMRDKVPQDTGKLRKSIRTNAWMKRRKGGEVSLFVRTGPRFNQPGRVFYAHFVELGTPGQTPAHFVKDTYGQHANSIERGIKQAVINALKRRLR